MLLLVMIMKFNRTYGKVKQLLASHDDDLIGMMLLVMMMKFNTGWWWLFLCMMPTMMTFIHAHDDDGQYRVHVHMW